MTQGNGTTQEGVTEVGELILLIVVAAYFCYGFYALNRESGWQVLNKLRDFSHKARLGLKGFFGGTKREKKTGRNIRKYRDNG